MVFFVSCEVRIIEQAGDFISWDDTVCGNGCLKQAVYEENFSSDSFVVEVEVLYDVYVAAVWIATLFFAGLNVVFKISLQEVGCFALKVVIFNVCGSRFASLDVEGAFCSIEAL